MLICPCGNSLINKTAEPFPHHYKNCWQDTSNSKKDQLILLELWIYKSKSSFCKTFPEPREIICMWLPSAQFKVYGPSGRNNNMHEKWAAQHRSKPRSKRTFLSSCAWWAKWCHEFESSIQLLQYIPGLVQWFPNGVPWHTGVRQVQVCVGFYDTAIYNLWQNRGSGVCVRKRVPPGAAGLGGAVSWGSAVETRAHFWVVFLFVAVNWIRLNCFGVRRKKSLY